MRAPGSQTDDKALSNGEQHVHGFRMCNTKLNERQGELDKLLSVPPEIQNFKLQVATFEKGKEKLTESLESTKGEVEDFLKDQASVTAAKLKATTYKLVKLDDLERSVLKQECFNIINNIKFWGLAKTRRNPQTTQK